MKRRTGVAIGVGVALFIALAAAGFALWRVLGGSAPPPVALNSVPASAGATASGSAGGSLDGTWPIDATSGYVAECRSVFAGQRAEDEHAGTGANPARRSTRQLSG